MFIRAILAVTAVGLIAVQVIRNGAVQALAESRPSAAAQFWSDHPAVELSLGMSRIREASLAHQTIPDSAFAMIKDAAIKQRLAPEPFLVRGVQAQLVGDDRTAQRAFEAAQWREPRSRPAAYFLANRYYRAADLANALREIALVTRLAPESDEAFAPYLAAYAEDPRNWPALRTLFRANPELTQPALKAMAQRPATAPAVLALADPHQTAKDAQWLPPLLATLTAAGDYGRARAIWQRMSGVQARGLLYDSSFTDKTSPPPFNWALTSSTVGLAERQPGGRLHVLFYGQEDGFLATEMLILAPGQYRLSMQLLGDRTRAHALNWSIWCDKAEAPIASVALDVAAARGWAFTVPANCPAQWLKLSGVSGDVSQQIDATITSLNLEKVGSGA